MAQKNETAQKAGYGNESIVALKGADAVEYAAGDGADHAEMEHEKQRAHQLHPKDPLFRGALVRQRVDRHGDDPHRLNENFERHIPSPGTVLIH